MIDYGWARWIALLVQGEQKRQADIRQFRITRGDSKNTAETLTEAISFVGKSFPKREIFGAFGNVVDRQCV
jgi:hypothetical protein